ncbi:MAG: hypothetical protein KF700_01435 [Hyphomonadaceae bacterium]|nr:hypothetical protein [Hyphomonadaceae bacterium]
MKRVKPLRRAKAGARKKKSPASVSTSQARANFAGALGAAQAKNAILGFERYGKPIAALVPVDAVRMLAGEAVERATQAEITAAAQQFVQAMLGAAPAPAKAPPKKKPALKRKRKSLGKGV